TGEHLPAEHGPDRYRRLDEMSEQRALPLERPFVLQQPPLSGQASSEARQAAVRADDAMTGDDNRHGVLAIRRSDCTGGPLVADPLGQLSVGPGRPRWNPPQAAPYPRLERRAVEADRQLGEGIELAVEEAAQGRACAAGVLPGPFLHLPEDATSPASERVESVERHAHQDAILGRQAKRPDWRFEFRELEVDHRLENRKACFGDPTPSRPYRATHEPGFSGSLMHPEHPGLPPAVTRRPSAERYAPQDVATDGSAPSSSQPQ